MGRDGSDLALPVEAVGFSGSEWLRKVAQDAATDEIKPSWMTARRPGATAAPATAPATQAGYAQMAGYAGVMNPMMAGMPPMGAWQPGMPMGYPQALWGVPPPVPRRTQRRQCSRAGVASTVATASRYSSGWYHLNGDGCHNNGSNCRGCANSSGGSASISAPSDGWTTSRMGVGGRSEDRGNVLLQRCVKSQ